MPNIKEPLVSVIVPVYNVEKYIAKCLDSIIGQSYKNLEIIIVNDASTDSSGKIADEYALKDSRIKVIHKKNEGVSAARNAALDIASGEYINMVDSDDWIEPDTYAIAVETIRKHNVDMVYWAFFEVKGEEKRPIKINFTPGYIDGKLKEKFIGDRIAAKMLGYVCTSLLKAEILKKYNIRMPEGITIYEDLIFLVLYLLRCGSLYVLNDKHLYNYLQRENSATKKYDGEYIKSCLKMIDELAPYLKDNAVFMQALSLRVIVVIFYALWLISGSSESFGWKTGQTRLLRQNNQITPYLQKLKFRDFLSAKAFSAFLVYKGFIRASVLYIAFLKTAHRIIRSL